MILWWALSKKDTTWKTAVNNLSVFQLQGSLVLFVDKRDDFVNKNENFYYHNINKVLTTINNMPHQLFAADIKVRDIYLELRKYLFKKYLNVA